MGLTTFATFSDGQSIENPRFFKKEEAALAKAQKKLTKEEKRTTKRKQKDSL